MRRSLFWTLVVVLSVLLATAKLDAGDRTAAADFERSAALLEAAGDRFCAWMALWQAGTVELGQRHPVEALALYRRSLALLREIEAAKEPFSIEGLKYLGARARLGDMRLLLERRPDLARPVLLRLAEALSRKGMAVALLSSRRLAEAETELARVVELSEPLGKAFGDEVAVLRGHLHWQQGRREEAREILRAVLEGKRLSPEREWNVLSSLIQLAVADGLGEEAMALYDRAAALVRLLGRPAEESVLLGLRAEILVQGGTFPAAEEALIQALALARHSGSLHQQAMIERQLGELAAQTKKTEKAATHFEAAIGLFQTAREPWEEARIWLQLADLYSQVDSRPSADAALEKAHELFRRSGSPVAQAETDLMEAVLQLRAGRTDINEVREKFTAVLGLPELQDTPRGQKGRELLGTLDNVESILANPWDEAWAAGADRGDAGGISAMARHLLSILPLIQKGDLAAARKALEAALAETSTREEEIAVLTMLGMTYAGELKLQEATSSLVRAVAAIEQGAEGVQREEFLAAFLGSQQVPFTFLIELLALQGRDAEAFNYAERARARAFLLGFGNPRIVPRGGADPKLVAEAEELRKQIIDLERRSLSVSADRKQLSSALSQARERLQSLLFRLKVTNPNYSSRSKVEPLQLQAVQAELPPDTTLISYYSSGAQVHAWVVEKEAFQHILLPLGPQDLRRAVCWAEEVGHRAGERGVKRLDPACETGTPWAEELYEKLVAPLAAHVRHRRLVLVPHDVLHYLPFAALRNPATGRHLIEDYTLTYLPSASVLGALRSKETPVEGRALVLGAPEALDPKLEALPAARQEAEAVGHLFGTRPLLGAAATEGRLGELSGKIDLLHVAAHGIFEPQSSQFSRIALTPDEEHDGNLEVHEILSDLDLSGVNLVVLSACETARGERSGGDEITSLTRAFLSAGSPAVVSTLWSVNDTATAVLMMTFYQHLLAGTPTADALRQAQLSLLRSPDYKDPYFWAAFSLTGDPGGTWELRPTGGPGPSAEVTASSAEPTASAAPPPGGSPPGDSGR